MRKTKALRIIKQMKTQNRSDRKLLLKIKELRPKTQLFSSLAGVAGFEPTNVGTKSRCLTTWRRPNVFHTFTKIDRPSCYMLFAVKY